MRIVLDREKLAGESLERLQKAFKGALAQSIADDVRYYIQDLKQDLTKANAKIELLLDRFVYSEGLCSALRITEKEHRCPTPDECDECWQSWLDKETK